MYIMYYDIILCIMYILIYDIYVCIYVWYMFMYILISNKYWFDLLLKS